MIPIIAKLLHIKGPQQVPVVPVSAQAGPTIVGYIDGLVRDQIRGWAMNVCEPSARLTVDVVGGSGELLTSVVADRYRADVQKAGYGDGHYGFAVRSIKLRSIGSPRLVCGSPRMELKRFPSLPAIAAAMTLERANILLHLDCAPLGSFIAGWIMDRHHPDERRRMRFRAGDRVLAMLKATLFRPDSMSEGGDGFHGFRLPLPTDPRNLFIDDVMTGFEFRIS